MGVEDEYQAFCLDQAIATLGNGITHRLDSVGGDKKSRTREAKLQRQMQKELATILKLPEEVTEKQYRSPTVSR